MAFEELRAVLRADAEAHQSALNDLRNAMATELAGVRVQLDELRARCNVDAEVVRTTLSDLQDKATKDRSITNRHMQAMQRSLDQLSRVPAGPTARVDTHSGPALVAPQRIQVRRPATLSQGDPIFICGAPRSGTTLVGKILNSHSDVFLFDEIGVLAALRYCNAIKMAPGNARQLRQEFEESSAHSYFSASGVIDLFYNNALQSAEARTILSETLSHLSNSPKKNWGEKNPMYLDHVDELSDFFGNARFIYVKRDPRAIVSSYLRYKESDLRTADDFWICDSIEEAALSLQRFLKPWKKQPERFYTVQYEALLSDPTREISLLCDHLQIPFEPTMLNYERGTLLPGSVEANQLHRHQTPIPWKSPNLMSLTPFLGDRWKGEWSDSELDRLNEQIGPLARELGYE